MTPHNGSAGFLNEHFIKFEMMILTCHRNYEKGGRLDAVSSKQSQLSGCMMYMTSL